MGQEDQWKNFIVSQAGGGLHAALSMACRWQFGLYIAVTRARTNAAWRRRQSRGCRARGGGKTVPDAVILRQTANDKEGATALQVAAHDKEPFIGMAIGIEWDPSRQRPSRPGEVSVIHATQDGGVIGGFTLQLVPARASRPRPEATRLAQQTAQRVRR